MPNKPNKYENLRNNIKDISEHCYNFGHYSKLLNSNNSAGGYCLGLTMMWGQAVLANGKVTHFMGQAALEEDEVERYVHRLNMLTGRYLDRSGDFLTNQKIAHGQLADPRKSRLSYSINQRINHRRRHPKAPVNLIDSIRPFLDGLLMYQYPMETSLRKVDKELYGQKPMESSKYVANDKIGSLREIYNRPFVGNKEDYRGWLSAILNVTKRIRLPFFVVLVSEGHAIGLSYLYRKIKIYDANYMDENEYCHTYSTLSEDCLSDVFKSFSKTQHSPHHLLAVNIVVYYSSKDYPAETGNIFEEEIKKYRGYLSYILSQNYHIINPLFLIIASKKGHADVVEQLLSDSRTNLNHQTKKGWTALDMASTCGHANAVHLLLKYSANPNELLPNGTTALYSASQSGSTGVVEQLLRDPRTNPNQASKGCTPLSTASAWGHADIVRLLLEQKGKRSVDPNQLSSKYRTPLHLAAKKGSVDVVRLLMMDPRTNHPNQGTIFQGCTALYIASEYGRTDVVRFLLQDRRINHSQATSRNWTPLCIASKNGHADVVNLLLNYGAYINQISNV